MALAQFMASLAGRAIRMVAGIVLIAVGLLALEGTSGIVVAAIGVVPILAGMFNVCLIAPLIGAPFSGKAVRSR